jgi:hypothetical protein
MILPGVKHAVDENVVVLNLEEQLVREGFQL